MSDQFFHELFHHLKTSVHLLSRIRAITNRMHKVRRIHEHIKLFPYGGGIRL